MNIKTKRLTLVPCTEDFLSSIIDKYEIGPHIDFHIEELKKDATILGWGPWFVIDNESNSVIGDIGFKGRPQADKIVEVGYGIIPSEWGKGYATEAVNEIVNWAFASQRVDRVIAECLDDNYASIKVLKKLGMEEVGKEDNMIKWELQEKQ
ncbi:GNAT family N-acetyltransferase [Sporosarcina sp. ANT_H38]|uniref:GNAT family N-acetyltransferase n=1 Tax=Sporosarcina sp. ANT_H38 TaxID=2597358 RepID=UPI0011F2CF52|nr:GNAT family N-acetyltransferase [Sporosarcina sp. ANT_H38]KAA0948753.1 GNAT family N-acetyltransferase [Sporosarcina sp. ANT_H38]